MDSEAWKSLCEKRTLSKYEERGKSVQTILEGLQNDQDFSCLYSYQISAALATGRLLTTPDGNRKPSEPVLIVAPTGSGKSGIITLLPYVLRSRKLLVLTPSIAISQQLARAFGINNKKDSFFSISGLSKKAGASEENFLNNVLATGVVIKDRIEAKTEIVTRLSTLVIVNAQKFGGNSNLSLKYEDKEIVDDVDIFFSQFDTLIVDEAHHYPAATWDIIVKQFQKSKNDEENDDDIKKQIIFVTATPYRYENGVQTNILVNQEFRIAYEIKNEDVIGKTVRKQKFEERKSFSYKQLFNDIQELLNKNAKLEPRIRKHQAIILVHTKDEAEKIAKKLNDLTKDKKFAIPIVRGSSNARVQNKISEFTKGTYQVAVNCRILTEGYDNTSVTLCVILKKVQSKILFNQFIGRAMRMKKFKKKAGDNNPDPDPDQSTAYILSYAQFEQESMWKERNKLADKDPTDKDDNEEMEESRDEVRVRHSSNESLSE